MLSRISLAALPLLGISVAYAYDQSANELDTVVVTATRTARTADETLVPVTVITRADIERSQARSIGDMLSGQVGVSVVNNGGPGKLTNVFLRGANSDHVLVLLDGVKIGSATAGTAAFQDIPVELIDRIEIVRGPRSSLYGSEAIGGVIQIFTRKGGATHTPSLTLGVGSYSSSQAAATLSGPIGSAGWYSMGLSSQDTGGFNSCRGSFSAGCFTVEPDSDGYHNLSGRVRAGWRFDNNTELELNWLRAQGRNEYDGGFVNQSATVQQVLGAGLSFRPTSIWRSSVRVGQSLDNSDNFKDGVFRGRFDTTRDTFSWQNDFDLSPGQQLVAGLDWQKDRINSDTAYTVSSRKNTAVFAQYLAALAGHEVQLSLRRDDNEQFGSKNTGGAVWGYALSPKLRLTASYGTAFKAPTFNQLYFPFGFGNPDLRPEKSRNLDFGMAGKMDAGNWSVNVFENRISEMIVFIFPRPVNVDSARIRGIETTASTRIYEWNVAANLTLLDPENRGSGPNYGNLLPRRAHQTAMLSADREFGAWSAGATLRGSGRRYDDVANTIKLGAYATVDLRAEYRLNQDWRLQGRIENLFDREYETAYLFNQPRRSAYLTLRYQPR
ncbi:MAG: TonB-dependent vitamin B12 receptor [Rhodocyclaceae bacterium]|nr:TonB-dependent vitamin B12 receptor [Rhodocyclaceae bacterium]